MKKKSKFRTIFEAFTEELPTTEKWFQDRWSKCDTCDYNSDNIENDKLSVGQKVQINTLCGGKSMCTACGCCLLEKLGRKTETCGKATLGLQPEWLALKAETSSSSLIDVELTGNDNYKISIDEKGQFFNINIGESTRIVEEVTILVSKRGGLRVSSVKPSCSCTVPTQEQINAETVKMTIKINTSGFSKNTNFSKSVAINYYVNSRGTRSTTVKITGLNK